MTANSEKLRSGSRRGPAAALFAVLLALLVIAGCGGSGGGGGIDPGNAQDAPDFTKVTNDAPKQIAPLYQQAGQLLGGGADAYNAQLAELKGYPVVVNKWASWCGPCRQELPHLQDAVAKRGDQVAFMGIDAKDSDAAAKTFIRDHPVPYLSFTDPDEELSTRSAPRFGSADHDLLQRRRQEDVHALGPVHLRGRAQRRHRQVRRQRLSGDAIIAPCPTTTQRPRPRSASTS